MRVGVVAPIAAVSVVGFFASFAVGASPYAALLVSEAMALLGASLINYLNDNKFRPFV